MADDNDDLKGPKTKPLRKTSAVPLRKETVRVTLKATPTSTSGAPRPPVPAPPKPPSVATTPLETTPLEDSPDDNTVPVSLKGGPDLPDVTSTVPLRQETMRVTLKSDTSGAPMAPTPTTGAAPKAPAPPAPVPSTPPAMPQPAPTIPLGNAAPPIPAPVPTQAPAPVQPAPTVPLTTGSPTPTVPIVTQPLGVAPGSNQPLPQATVELQQTQQITAPLGMQSQVPTLQNTWEEEITRGQSVLNILAIAAFVLALAALGLQLMHAKQWLDEHKNGDWAELAKMPSDNSKFPQKKSASEYSKKY